MEISESWLREWVDPAIDSDTLMSQLTMAGLEVDGWRDAAPALEGVVVADVVSVEQHPNADKLSLCQVDDGSDRFAVICGASNVREGLKVAFARIGAELPGMRIKKAKLRGVESQGMICSASEMGLAESSEGILELPADAPAGVSIVEYLGLIGVGETVGLDMPYYLQNVGPDQLFLDGEGNNVVLPTLNLMTVFTPIPEPSTGLLVALGLGGLVFAGKRRE